LKVAQLIEVIKGPMLLAFSSFPRRRESRATPRIIGHKKDFLF
jgi:hypothetical protein